MCFVRRPRDTRSKRSKAEKRSRNLIERTQMSALGVSVSAVPVAVVFAVSRRNFHCCKFDWSCKVEGERKGEETVHMPDKVVVERMGR